MAIDHPLMNRNTEASCSKALSCAQSGWCWLKEKNIAQVVGYKIIIYFSALKR